MTAALLVLWLLLSPPPPSSLAPIEFRMETFWCWLSHVIWKMAVKMETERERERFFHSDVMRELARCCE